LIKLICHFKRKPGLTLEQFRDYYENHHVKLVLELLPHPIDYRRNYRIDDAKFDPFDQHADGEPDYDVITESWYRREDLEEMAVIRARPEIDGPIVADEEEFMDRSATQLMLFEEYGTQGGVGGFRRLPEDAVASRLLPLQSPSRVLRRSQDGT
jgi:hypothetical protein